jgi:Leucine-rich repeat (LRR) protein
MMSQLFWLLTIQSTMGNINFMTTIETENELTINFDHNLQDISFLRNKKNLVKLNLSCNRIFDISPLESLTNLKHLDLSYNKGKIGEYKLISNISALSNLINLEYLNLSCAEITDISPLKNLVNLRILYIEDNKISDISPLSNLKALESLCLGGNKISNISSLKNLVNLRELTLYSIPYKTQFPLAYTKVPRQDRKSDLVD